ncbi:MAG: MBL fold metallo-hydrolase [Thermoplasmata archaeon]|nr:MBL fold metallo-hydrolase [Thermoplasmata archaeon]
MKLTILYDNQAKNGFKSGWGFSCLIKYADKNIMFDTGWDANVLLHNMGKLGIAKEEIEIIVLSHAHWDHIGGLTQVMHPKMEVYVPASFSKNLKHEISQRAALREVNDAREIVKGVYTTGELGEDIKEQVLAVETDDGLIVITGCAHPGLDIILKTAREFGKVIGAIGGFHSFDKLDQLDNLSLIVPCHCTAYKTAIERRFSDRVKPCGSGEIVYEEK